MKKTELIASWLMRTVRGIEMYIVTTVSGAEIWVPATQFDTNAETITYLPLKAGDKVVANKDSSRNDDKGKPVYLKGDSIVLKADRNEFKGCGRQIIRKFNQLELLEFMASKGMNNAITLS